MQVQSLGQEYALEKKMATRSSILPCKIPWTEEPDRLQSMGSQRVRHDLATKQQKYICTIRRNYHIFSLFILSNLLLVLYIIWKLLGCVINIALEDFS